MSTTTKSPRKVLACAYAVAKKVLPMYSHRFSPHKFTLPQLFACMVLKTFLKTDYRGLVEWLSDCPNLCNQIELTKVPHFTTIQKASKYVLALPNANKLLEQTIRMSLQQSHIAHAAIDSTGLDARYTSHYFVWRRNVKGLTSYQSMLYAKYPKLIVLCDCFSHLILSLRTARGPSPDMATLIPTLQALPKGITIETLLADAGYDSERNHVYARDYRRIRSIILPNAGRRSKNNDLPRTKYRRLMKQQFNRSLYSKRSQVETVMSMIKRRWGCAVRAHGTLAQTRELWLMALTHNLAIFWPFIRSFSTEPNEPNFNNSLTIAKSFSLRQLRSLGDPNVKQILRKTKPKQTHFGN